MSWIGAVFAVAWQTLHEIYSELLAIFRGGKSTVSFIKLKGKCQ